MNETFESCLASLSLTEEERMLARQIDQQNELRKFQMGTLANTFEGEEIRQEIWDFLNSRKTGYKLPWNSLAKDFLLAKGELTLVSGYTGNGKSEVVSHILLDVINQGGKGLIASLELTRNELMGRIITQATGTSMPTQEYFNHTFDHYRNTLSYYDTRGVADIRKILEGCKFLVEEYDYDFFVFDNLMMLDAKVDDYNKQFENAQKISEFAKQFKVSVVLVAHARKPNISNGKYFCPGIYDIHGASSVANLADNHFSVTINSNKLAVTEKAQYEPLTFEEEEILKEGDSFIRRDKKREHGKFFKKPLYYDPKFRRLKEFETEKLSPYVPLFRSPQ